MNPEFIDELTEFIKYFIDKYDLKNSDYSSDEIVILNQIISDYSSDTNKIKNMINNTIKENKLKYPILN